MFFVLYTFFSSAVSVEYKHVFVFIFCSNK